MTSISSRFPLAHACEMEMKASEDGLLDQHKAIAARVAAGPEK
jgi:hypothetical protein